MKNVWWKGLAALSFLLMVGINALANIVKFNGVTSGEVSDAYPNLFAPAGFTFSIWGLIYTMLLTYVIYQLGLGQTVDKKKEEWIKKINGYFVLSSLANATWIFAWHFDRIFVSLLLIITILVSLILVAKTIKSNKLNWAETAFVKWPFAIYFGWLTIATIANVTVFLVSINWSGWGVNPEWWMVMLLAVGSVIGMKTMWWFNSLIYGLVFVWANLGIYEKHTSIAGWASEYPVVITAVVINLALWIISLLYLGIKRVGKK